MSSLIEQATQRLENIQGAQKAEFATFPAKNKNPSRLSNTAVTVEQPSTLNDRERTTDPKSAITSAMVNLDLEVLSSSGIVSPHAPRSHLADQYRVIKRPLISNAMGRGAAMIANGNLIMVTSAVSGEGKSFTAINLAMSIATELDHTVLLVDADVARPSVLRMLGVPPCAGLLDVLIDDSRDLATVLLRTNIEKLTLLPSGTPHPRATELLASESMVQLLLEMASRYHDRIIIFDSPPLLLTTESRVLASHMGQVLMVVQAERTLQADVQLALSMIDACPVKLVMLNQATASASSEYGYGYGYSYGYGQEVYGYSGTNDIGAVVKQQSN